MKRAVFADLDTANQFMEQQRARQNERYSRYRLAHPDVVRRVQSDYYRRHRDQILEARRANRAAKISAEQDKMHTSTLPQARVTGVTGIPSLQGSVGP